MNYNKSLENYSYQDRSNLSTEQSNPKSLCIDQLSTYELVRLFSEEDIIPQRAVSKVSTEIAKAIDSITNCIRNNGRLFYIGAGTSGRIGVLDASECPPTFCTPPELVQGLIAGGYESLYKSSEALEDDSSLAINDLLKKGFNSKDSLIGITAGGTTKYVVSALNYSLRIKALAIAISCVPKSQVSIPCNIDIRLLTGPELLTGSTRLKAGTATKMALNTISTSVMIKLGKVYKNRMVDLSITNSKLKDRAIRILSEIAKIEREEAILFLDKSKGFLKPAILMSLHKLSYEEASCLLDKSNNNINKAIEMLIS